MVFEMLEDHRQPLAAPTDLPVDAEEQCRREDAAEAEITSMYEAKDVLSQPASYGRYLNRPILTVVAPLRWLGVTDDLTGPDGWTRTV